MNAEIAFNKLLSMEFSTVLDVGSGAGEHARAMREASKQVTTIAYTGEADIIGDYCETDVGQFDAIWASHVLEHQPDPGKFLRKCYADLSDNGILAVTVPPMKPSIVGGHLTLWNAGLLLYGLILAGFDCSQAMVKTYGYNVSVIVRKRPADLPDLHMDRGDIERLAHLFPMPVKQGFNGNIASINWS